MLRGSMSIFTTSGFTSGGGGVPTGMLRFTECSWIGMVMISMISSTSITSISGVVLMSTITSASREPLPEPTFIDMSKSSLGWASGPGQPRTGGSVMNPTLAIPARWQA